MIILSKYRDYYDGAVGMGIDKTIVYERHLKEMIIPKNIHEKLNKTIEWGDSFTWTYGGWGIKKIPEGKFNTSLIVVGFCGKLYVGIKITTPIVNDTYEYRVKFVFNHDKIVKILKKEQNNRNSYDKKHRKTYVQNYENYLLRIKAIDPTEWFREHNSPVFVYGTTSPTTHRTYDGHNSDKEDFFVNPALEKYMFAKVVDPYTAFQEIQMYVSGVLGVNKDGTEFPATEKEKIAQHGMNKWSFRTPPKR